MTSLAPPPLRVLCITLGGDRQERIKQIFSQSDFQLSFVSGINQRQLRSRKGLFQAMEDVHIFDTTTDESVKEACWRAMRHLNRDRAVFACTLAHLKAMYICANDQEGYDCIIEDNICGPIHSQVAAQRVRRMIEATPTAHVRYFAYGGRATEIIQWQQELENEVKNKISNNASVNRTFTHWPTKCLPNPIEDSGKKASILWGLMAYKTSKTAYKTIMKEIKLDLPGSLAFQLKRAKNHTAKPIDKIVPRFCTKNSLQMAVSIQPSFFRAPVKSTIHPKLDEQFLETTSVQLRLCGLSWSDLDIGVEWHQSGHSSVDSGSSGGNVNSGEGEEKQKGWTGKQHQKKKRQIPAPPKPVVCSKCGFSYPSKNSLFKHLRDSANECEMET
jgi:GR25 family glycosyltransferase involved in LPS biosynthesis